MNNTRFSEMLSVLNKKDYKRFSDLVNSPYFNKNARVSQLWKWIMENPKEIYTKDELEKAVVSDSPINDSNFRMVVSDFVKLAEVFLLLENNDIISGHRDRLIEILSEKGLRKSYNKHLLTLKEETAHEDNKDVSYYNSLYIIECEELGRDKGSERVKRLTNINTLTDFIWLTMKLDNFIKSFMLGSDLQAMSFYNDILTLIEKDKNTFKKNHPVIYSRYLILKMFQQPFEGNQYFAEFEKYTAKLSNRLMLRYNYDALLTYCRMKEEYKKEYSIIKLLDKKNLLANENGQVEPARLELIINSTLVNNRLAEAERLREKYVIG